MRNEIGAQSSKVEKSRSANITSKIELVTPQMAKEYLESQITNRTWRRDVINRYKAEMLAGTWYLNGEALIFDEKGRLIDGQHRLMALIEANKSVEMMVTTGIQSGLEKTIDSGKSRSLGDVFQMNRIRNSKLLSRTSKLLLVWNERFDEIVQKRSLTKDMMNIHPQKIYDFYLENKLEIDRACGEFKKNTPLITNTGSAVLAFVFLILEKIDLERCYAFITSYTSGNIKKDWPYMVEVRDAIISRTRKNTIRITEAERLSILFGMWNAIYHNRPVEEVKETIFNIPLELTQ